MVEGFGLVRFLVGGDFFLRGVWVVVGDWGTEPEVQFTVRIPCRI